MNKIDELALDGQLLRVFLTVLEEGAVTAAAQRLGVTQSAVSHGLKRLTRIVGAPLFVRRGRGIMATAQAVRLEPKARALVAALADFSRRDVFDPKATRWSLTVAANDLQRDLVLPQFWRTLSELSPDVRLRVLPSEVPTMDLLRAERCDLVLTPHPPKGGESMQRLLFKDRYVCYFDAEVWSGPRTAQDYLAADHATVVHPSGAPLQFDQALLRLGIVRRIVVEAPSFAGVSAFLRGTRLVATMPSLLAAHVMRGFGTTPIPLRGDGAKAAAALRMFLVWHRRVHDDPAHKWLRQRLVESATLALAHDTAVTS